MAYGNIFPASYQPLGYQQPQQMQQMQQPQMMQQPQPQLSQNNPMVWVQGETGAKSYLLAPNTTLPLWDSESQTIYLKSTDASGMPSMKIIDYVIRDTTTTQAPIPTENNNNNFVTHEELKEFEKKIIEEVKSHEQSIADDSDGKPNKK